MLFVSGATLGLAAACDLNDPTLSEQTEGGAGSGGADGSGGTGTGGARDSGGASATGGSGGGGAGGRTESGGSSGSVGSGGDTSPDASDASDDGGDGVIDSGDTPIDPCATNPCGPNGSCSRNGSAASCSCNVGYTVSGTTCVNVDECAEGTSDCHSTSVCNDRPGTFTCECPLGYAGGIHGVACRPRVATGSAHACALLADGTVKCWGDNANGQLGDGTTTPRSAPTLVPGLTNVVAIDSGSFSTCAIVRDGTAKCWGQNTSGQLGDNSKDNRPSPVAVSGLTSVVAIDTYLNHSCAALRDGTVRCWGSNSNGQIGASGIGTQVLTPRAIPGVTAANGVSIGQTQSCAVLGTNGSIQCWGEGFLGNTTNSSYTPIAVKDLTNVVEMTTGGFHACARQASGSIYCWGNPNMLGTGITTGGSTPEFVSTANGPSVGIGVYSTVVVERDGTAVWWGVGTKPADLAGVSNAAALSHTLSNICTIRRDGTVTCFTISNSTVTTPTVVPGLNVF